MLRGQTNNIKGGRAVGRLQSHLLEELIVLPHVGVNKAVKSKQYRFLLQFSFFLLYLFFQLSISLSLSFRQSPFLSLSIFLSICESINQAIYLFLFLKSLTSRVERLAYISGAVCGSSHYVYFLHMSFFSFFSSPFISGSTSCFGFA